MHYFNDIVYFNINNNSNYYLEDTFLDKLNHVDIDHVGISNFSICHVNIRSAPKHLNLL